MIDARFGESSPFSVGVEEEVMILDAETLEQVPRVDVFLEKSGFHTELFASVVELKTGVCDSARQAADELTVLRREGAAIAEENGLRLCAAGTHPLSDPESQPIFELVRELGAVSRADMELTFNLGVGMVAVVPPDDVFRTHDVLRSHGVGSAEIGEIVPGHGQVVVTT